MVFSVVRDCYSGKEGAKVYSYINGAICVVPALAPLLGGFLAELWGWRSNFIFMAIYGGLMLLVVSLALKETRPESTDTNAPLYRWARYQPVLTQPSFLFYASTCMCGMAAILSYVSYSPVWLIEHLAVSPLLFSVLFGLNAVVNIAAAFSAPKLTKKIGSTKSIQVALALFIFTGSLTALLSIVGPTQGIAAALAYMLPMMLLGISFSILLGPGTAMALSPFGERAGTAAALLGCIQMSGAALLTAIMQQTSLSAPMAVGLLMIVPPALLLWLYVASPFASQFAIEQEEQG